MLATVALTVVKSAAVMASVIMGYADVMKGGVGIRVAG